jgi:hypothetical protein
MATSLAVTVVNLGVGAVSRIPAENISASIDTDMDAVSFKILVFGANSLVIGLLVGKIIVLITFGWNRSFANDHTCTFNLYSVGAWPGRRAGDEW